MFDQILNYLQFATPLMIYLVLFLFPFIENIFPPSPSDLVILLGGTYIGLGKIAFIPALLLTSLSSEIGFLFLFYLGWQTDKKLVSTGRFKFISNESLLVAESWFAKYGFIIILFNRFIAGIRAVIAFFAGMSKLEIKKTVIYSSVSSVLWHFVLLSLGMLFGAHVKTIDSILSTYGTVLMILALVAGIALTIRYYINKKSTT